jgi:hypothetical protein
MQSHAADCIRSVYRLGWAIASKQIILTLVMGQKRFKAHGLRQSLYRWQ